MMGQYKKLIGNDVLRLKSSSALLGCLVLAACGGSTSVPFRTISERTVSNASLGFTVDRLSVADQISFDPNPETETALTFVRDTDRDLNGFEGYATADGSSIYMRSGSGNSSVAVIVSDQTVAEGYAGTVIARNAPTDLPLSGTASYTGDYAALVTNEATGEHVTTITGDVALTAEFENFSVSGIIDDRQFASGETLADLTLITSGVPFVDGVSTGFTSGGNASGTEAVDGFFSALIAGPSAGEVVGSVRLNHETDDADLIEHGAFVAGH
jgi:hypothetical protein